MHNTELDYQLNLLRVNELRREAEKRQREKAYRNQPKHKADR